MRAGRQVFINHAEIGNPIIRQMFQGTAPAVKNALDIVQNTANQLEAARQVIYRQTVGIKSGQFLLECGIHYLTFLTVS